MDLQGYVSLVRRYWMSVVATLMLVVAMASGLTLLQSRSWTATTSLYVAVESGGTAGELSQGANYAERQVKSFVEVSKAPYVLNPVIDRLGLDMTAAELAKTISVSAPLNTSVIEIAVTGKSPTEAAQISNEVSANLSRAVDELSPRGARGERLVRATVIEQAEIPTAPTSPKPKQNLALGLLLGALLGLGQALLRDRLDTRVRTVSDVETVTDAAVVGVVARHSHAHVDESSGYSSTAEAFRTMRTNLAFLSVAGERRRALVITSSLPEEGKTETAVRLAKALAEAGERVLLVDGDMRRPQVAARLGIEGAAGLSHVLSGQASHWDLLQQVSTPGLDVLAAGQIPPNPAELLGSDAMRRFLDDAQSRYNHVIVDAPPLLPVTDAAVLTKLAGSALVVVRSGVVRTHELGAALGTLSAGGGSLAGLVLNDVPSVHSGPYAGHYYYRTKPVAPSAQEATLELVKEPDTRSLPVQPVSSAARRAVSAGGSR